MTSDGTAAHVLDDLDRERVRSLLGRAPQGGYEVAVRDADDDQLSLL